MPIIWLGVVELFGHASTTEFHPSMKSAPPVAIIHLGSFMPQMLYLKPSIFSPLHGCLQDPSLKSAPPSPCQAQTWASISSSWWDCRQKFISYIVWWGPWGHRNQSQSQCILQCQTIIYKDATLNKQSYQAPQSLELQSPLDNLSLQPSQSQIKSPWHHISSLPMDVAYKDKTLFQDTSNDLSKWTSTHPSRQSTQQ